MGESCSQQTALAARTGSEPTASERPLWSMLASLPTRPASQQHQHEDDALGKEAGEAGSLLTHPKLIPQQAFPIHYRPLFFIHQTRQTPRQEHSGSAYSKHRSINMETTDPRMITGWVRYIYIPQLVMPQHHVSLSRNPVGLIYVAHISFPFRRQAFYHFHLETYLQDFPNPHCR